MSGPAFPRFRALDVRHAEVRSVPMEAAFVRAKGALGAMLSPLAGLATEALRRHGWSEAEIAARCAPPDLTD
ncbi:MAG TPA: hypothetical protein VF699_05565 [Caulobacteraceae bacterium]